VVLCCYQQISLLLSVIFIAAIFGVIGTSIGIDISSYDLLAEENNNSSHPFGL